MKFDSQGRELVELDGAASVPQFTSSTSGIVPGSGGGTSNFLRADGAWAASGGTDGTYTPTITGIANVSSSTAYVSQYTRVGNVVTVSGKVEIAASSAATTTFDISLPVASNFAAEENCGGVVTHTTPIAGRVYAESTNDRARCTFGATGASTFALSFIFQYRVI